MQAFHNDQAIKDKYVNRVKHHIEMDNLIRGEGWNEDGKGCAVGCTLEKYDHKAYETELGIPEWLARLEDTLFENMSFDKSKTWPLEFLKAIRPGVDLEKVKAPFLIFILRRTLEHFDHQKFPNVKQAIDSVIDLYEIGEATTEDFAGAAEAAWAAETAVRAAETAAETAAGATWAAWAAARAAGAAAMAAARAAETAARAAGAAGAAWAAAWAAGAAGAAGAAEFDMYADKLLELMRECK